MKVAFRYSINNNNIFKIADRYENNAVRMHLGWAWSAPQQLYICINRRSYIGNK